MYLSLSALVALSTFSFLDFATPILAGNSRFHRHHAASHASSVSKRDAAPGLVEIPIGDLQLLRMEMTAFQEWMHSWMSTANASDPATNLAQLKLQFQAYDGWMTAWLDSTFSPSPPPPLPSSIPVTTSMTSSVTIASSSAAVVVESAPQADTPTSSETNLTTTIQAGEFLPSKPAAATTLIPVYNSSPVLSVVSTQLTSSSTPTTSTSTTSTISSSSAPAATEPTNELAAPATPPRSDSSTFDAQSSSNLAVYYGQSPATSQMTLAQLCQDPHVDIVILAFLTTFFGPGGYPSLNLGAACSGPSAKMQAAGASGLLKCPTLEADIQTCQSMGKKVLLSLGGAIATTAFSSDAQASTFATQLWDLFGDGEGERGEGSMRPFGRAVLDGFDVDNEDHSTAFYSTFVAALRAAMDTAPAPAAGGGRPQKKYYISAAPQCPRPDASIPLDAMQTMDFVFVQFYNNGDCNVGQPGFEASLRAWSQDLRSAKGGNAPGPKLYIGAPGCSACAGSGYLGAGEMAGVLERAKAAGLDNLGGVMLWDGPEGKANVEGGGQSYLSAVKKAVA
ncbi:MAG: hypothetical protein Q9185_004908 [Variospora sp. 1 TL-2023]